MRADATTPIDASTAAYRAARRGYELGRLRIAFWRAALVTALIAASATMLFGPAALGWIALPLVVITFTEWRGAFLMTGARRGLLAGFGSMFLPLSILRPCCGVDGRAMGVDCCVMPSACWAAGALVGFVMTLALPKAPEGHRRDAALGLILGVLSVAVVRCSMLFIGEAIGLLGGLSAGIVATALARAFVQRLRAADG